MSCPNFHKVHARNYYVVTDETTFIDPETDEEVVIQKDQFDYDLDIECAIERSKEKGFYGIDQRERSNYYNNRMGGCPFMRSDEVMCFGNGNDFNRFICHIDIYVQDGYYCGFNYDWDIRIETYYGDTFDLSGYYSNDDFIKDIIDHWKENASYGGEWNEGLIKIQTKNIRKWLEKQIELISNKADDVCRDICEEVYVCGGIFSNGEAVYYKENSLKGKVNNIEAA